MNGNEFRMKRTRVQMMSHIYKLASWEIHAARDEWYKYNFIVITTFYKYAEKRGEGSEVLLDGWLMRPLANRRVVSSERVETGDFFSYSY